MMSNELNRLQVLQKMMEHRMTHATAAQALVLSYRQMKRLMARFRQQGAAGLVSGRRGKQGNRRLPTSYTDHILDLLREQRLLKSLTGANHVTTDLESGQLI